MKSAVREHDVVARIGGDEFAVIFWDNEAPRRANSRHPADIAKVVERFRKALAAHLPVVMGLDGIGRLEDGRLVGFGGTRPPYGAMAEKTVIPQGYFVPVPERVDAATPAPSRTNPRRMCSVPI